jgi:hypothetical protein
MNSWSLVWINLALCVIVWGSLIYEIIFNKSLYGDIGNEKNKKMS